MIFCAKGRNFKNHLQIRLAYDKIVHVGGRLPTNTIAIRQEGTKK